MSEAARLRAALTELLASCREEMASCQDPEVLARMDQLENHLGEAEEVIRFLADTADSEQCSVAARRALLAVAQFRNALATK